VSTGIPRDDERIRHLVGVPLSYLETPEGMARLNSTEMLFGHRVDLGLVFVLFSADKIEHASPEVTVARTASAESLLVDVHNSPQLAGLCYTCKGFRGRCNYEGIEFENADREWFRNRPSDN
jgi:hypothetical protein